MNDKRKPYSAPTVRDVPGEQWTASNLPGCEVCRSPEVLRPIGDELLRHGPPCGHVECGSPAGQYDCRLCGQGWAVRAIGVDAFGRALVEFRPLVRLSTEAPN